MKLIVGLGNPGEKYRFTRHNSGFLVIERLAAKYNIKLDKIGCKAVYGKGRICTEEVVLALPQTYMNESGVSVKQLMSNFGVQIDDLIIIYDDVDIEPGSMRIRLNGSAGTHNGMRSVIYHIENDNFKRIRMGIGKAPLHSDIIDHVLGIFSDDEMALFSACCDDAVDAIALIISRGCDFAMNKYNKKKKQAVSKEDK